MIWTLGSAISLAVLCAIAAFAIYFAWEYARATMPCKLRKWIRNFENRINRWEGRVS